MSTDYPIFQSSPNIDQDRRTNVKRNLPWDMINIGQSFAVPKSEMKAVTLRPMCSNYGKKLHKKFKMVEHEDVYEVARIA